MSVVESDFSIEESEETFPLSEVLQNGKVILKPKRRNVLSIDYLQN